MATYIHKSSNSVVRWDQIIQRAEVEYDNNNIGRTRLSPQKLDCLGPGDHRVVRLPGTLVSLGSLIRG